MFPFLLNDYSYNLHTAAAGILKVKYKNLPTVYTLILALIIKLKHLKAVYLCVLFASL